MVLKGRGIPMERLIGVLESAESIGGLPIVDKTGFAGYFDVAELRLPGSSGPPDAADSPPPPSISTVLQDTLGLELVPRKAPVEVLVIDSIERPTEN